MPKRLFALLVVTTMHILLFGQGDFFVRNDNIQKWYKPSVGNEQEFFTLAATNEDFQNILSEHNTNLSEVLSFFHLIDFDNNGRLDVIFNGKIKQQDYVFLFLNKGNTFHLSFMGKGILYKSNEPDGDNCLNFSLYKYACCGEFICQNLQYAGIRTNNTFYFNIVSSELIFKGTFLPGKRIAPTPFKIKNSAFLRIEPIIDNERYIAGKTRWKGNAVALYAQGACGTIFAETTDGKGNYWYFVRMENTSNNPIHSDRFIAMEELDTEGFSYYGWIQHNDVEILYNK